MLQTVEFKFLDEYAPETLKTTIMSADVLTLPDLLMAFEDFLRGCGYVLKGSLEVVSDECSKT